MFKNVKKQLIFYVMASFFIVSAFIATSYYRSFRNILINNYTEKILVFSDHEAQIADTNMKTIGSSLNSIIDKLCIKEIINSERHNPFLINNINSYIPYYPFFSDYFICVNSSPLYVNGTVHSQLGNLNDFYKKLDFKNRNYNWIVSDSNSKTKLLYVQNLCSDKTEAYAVFAIDSDYVFSFFTSENQFINYENITVKSTDSGILPLVSKKKYYFSEDKSKNFTDYQTLNNLKYSEDFGRITSVHSLPYSNLTVYAVNKISYASGYTFRLLILVTVIILVIAALCYFVINRLARKSALSLTKFILICKTI